MIEKYVVSLELAKRMKKLGWEKETIYCWTINRDRNYAILHTDYLESFKESEFYAPLFAEIWEELPDEIQDIESGDTYTKILFDDNSIGYAYWSLGTIDIKILTDRSKFIKENAGNQWCWLKENGYMERGSEKWD